MVVPSIVPRNLSNFLDKFDVRVLARCEKLEEVLLDGIKLGLYSNSARDDICKVTLRECGLWVKRRQAKKHRVVEVWVGYRYSLYDGGTVKDWGEKL